MKLKYFVLPIIVVFVLGLVWSGISIAKAQAEQTPTWGYTGGVFTDAEGNEFNVTVAKANDLQSVETVEAAVDIIVTQNEQVFEGGTIRRSKSVTVTSTLPAGDIYLFYGNTYGCSPDMVCSGTWMPNATVTGAQGCEVFNNGDSTQIHCPAAYEGQTVVVKAIATVPQEAQNIVTDPYIFTAVNPSPSGGEYDRWNGVWDEVLYLSTIFK